jgi:UDP-GlcNAc:undecaprenyl-phosphate/decaprenyl-phosphate GlcNAc-1-phosphate transferase
MTVERAVACIVAALIGFATAEILASIRLETRVPRSLVRTNYRGRSVPAILGGPLAIGALVGLGCLNILAALGWADARVSAEGVAVAVVIVIMWTAGSWDDYRGDERPRGFKGHVGAIGSGVLTGGIVKLLAGAVAGAVAGVLLTTGWAVLETALLVALSANLVNLFDRAPGRAGKVAVVIVVALLLFGHDLWALGAAAMIGALAACLPFDLKEKAMLGDAGANPVGAVLGLGMAHLDRPVRLVCLAILVILNAASEIWSFSRAIESSRILTALDGIGRRK